MSNRREINIREQLKLLLCEEDKKVFIGTDSQQNGDVTEFVTVIVIVSPGKGGRVFYNHISMSRIDSLRERLMREVWMSLETAIELNDVISDKNELTIHIDINPVLKYKSSICIKDAIGLVSSQGFCYAVKPNSAVATHVADYIIKEFIM